MDTKQQRKQDALDAFGQLIDIIDRLRSPGGCPWDRKQTSKTLKPFLVEETYEALDAIDSEDPLHIQEELGDVLLQIMLHSQISFEKEEFHIGDVIRGLSDKMIERHPHVFGDTLVRDETDVVRNWEAIKAEKKENQSILASIPSALPGLMKAEKIGKKAGRVGFDWPDIAGVRAKVFEELDELQQAISEHAPSAVRHEFGDLLFAVAQWARHLKIDPEEALRQCCDRFSKRFAFVEFQAEKAKKTLQECSLEDLENYWQQAKQNESTH